MANEDPVLGMLMKIVLRGFPQSSYELEDELKQFYKFRHDLHVAEGVVCYKDRVVIPKAQGSGDHPRGQPVDVWHDEQGGGHGVLARDHH